MKHIFLMRKVRKPDICARSRLKDSSCPSIRHLSFIEGCHFPSRFALVFSIFVRGFLFLGQGAIAKLLVIGHSLDALHPAPDVGTQQLLRLQIRLQVSRWLKAADGKGPRPAFGQRNPLKKKKRI